MGAVSLSAAEARRMTLRAQGLLGAPDRRGGVPGMLRRLGAVQLDTISVLARSHELVPYARLGPVGRAAVEDAYWDGTRAFEYWSHAACVLPIGDWPQYAFRRRARTARGHRWHRLSDRDKSIREVLRRLREDGPLTTTALGGAKNGGVWWDWSETKIAVEWLLDTGEVVCTRRAGWKRVYDLAERAVPADLLAREVPDGEGVRYLVRRAGQALGVATRADLANYQYLKTAEVEAALEGSGLVPVEVEGWGAAWADPAALAAGPPAGRHRTTLLSPFDSLVWDRARVERVFGMRHRLEAYVPKAERRYGYFAMPVLVGGSLVGRVDPAREGRVLVARQIVLERVTAAAVEGVARALREAARWVGCEEVRVERLEPEPVRAKLEAALAALR